MTARPFTKGMRIVHGPTSQVGTIVNALEASDGEGTEPSYHVKTDKGAEMWWWQSEVYLFTDSRNTEGRRAAPIRPQDKTFPPAPASKHMAGSMEQRISDLEARIATLEARADAGLPRTEAQRHDYSGLVAGPQPATPPADLSWLVEPDATPAATAVAPVKLSKAQVRILGSLANGVEVLRSLGEGGAVYIGNSRGSGEAVDDLLEAGYLKYAGEVQRTTGWNVPVKGKRYTTTRSRTTFYSKYEITELGRQVVRS